MLLYNQQEINFISSPLHFMHHVNPGYPRFSEFYMICNVLLDSHMTVGNSYYFSKATDSPLHRPRGRHDCDCERV